MTRLGTLQAHVSTLDFIQCTLSELLEFFAHFLIGRMAGSVAPKNLDAPPSQHYIVKRMGLRYSLCFLHEDSQPRIFNMFGSIVFNRDVGTDRILGNGQVATCVLNRSTASIYPLVTSQEASLSSQAPRSWRRTAFLSVADSIHWICFTEEHHRTTILSINFYIVWKSIKTLP